MNMKPRIWLYFILRLVIPLMLAASLLQRLPQMGMSDFETYILIIGLIILVVLIYISADLLKIASRDK